MELSPVVVTATRVEEKSFDLPVSIDSVDRTVIEDKKFQVLVSEDLQRVPGTVVQNRGTFSQEEQIIIRGFGARSQFGTRGVKIYADGIPATTPDGQSSSALFDLASAARIEVLRGAFSALYGNHSGGVVQIFTQDGAPQPTVSGRYAIGSYGSWVAGAQFSGTAGRANYIASASRFETDGYRQFSGAQKDQFNGKVNFGLDNGAKLGVVFNYLNQPDNLDPGSLTAAQVAVDRRQAQGSALQFRTRRNLDNTQGGLVYEQALTSQDTLRVMGYLGARSNEQFLSTPLAATSQGAVKAAGGVSAFDRDLWGGSAWWTHRGEVGGTPFTLTAGGEYENASEDRKGYLNNFGAILPVPNAVGVLKRNEDNTTDTWGIFAQGEWQFAPAWSLSAGLRYTQVGVESADHFICTPTANTTGTPLTQCSGFLTGAGPVFAPGTVTAAANTQNPDDSGSVTHDAWTPVLGLLYRLSPTTNLYANVGKSFETPTLAEVAFRPDGGAGLNFSLQPSTSWQYEVGAKMFLGADTRLTAALFYIETDDEVVAATNSGGRSTFQNAPGTRRTGAELSVDSRFGRGFAGYLAATYLNAEFTEDFTTCVAAPPCGPAFPGTTAIVFAGNNIPNIPNYTVYGQLSWAYAPLGFTTGLEAWWQGKMYADDRNTATAGSYWVASLSAGFEQNWGGLRLSEFARVNNLFDREYIAALAVNNTNAQFYYPAANRNYLVGIAASYQF